jgi:hypothetical protein
MFRHLYFLAQCCDLFSSQHFEGTGNTANEPHYSIVGLFCQEPNPHTIIIQMLLKKRGLKIVFSFLSRNLDDLGFLLGNQLDSCQPNNTYIFGRQTSVGLQMSTVPKAESHTDICFYFDHGSVSICAQHPYQGDNNSSRLAQMDHQARNTTTIITFNLNPHGNKIKGYFFLKSIIST